jgi:hypothetical protein
LRKGLQSEEKIAVHCFPQPVGYEWQALKGADREAIGARTACYGGRECHGHLRFRATPLNTGE